jgi:hypothetical protein
LSDLSELRIFMAGNACLFSSWFSKEALTYAGGVIESSHAAKAVVEAFQHIRCDSLVMERFMSPTLFRAAMLGAALALAGCAAQAPETRVTRFHLGQPIARGEIAVEPRDPTMAQTIEFRTYADAVAAELTRAGFRVAPGVAKSELVAVVDVARGSRGMLQERSPFSVGIGGGSFGGGVGVGGGVSFPIGKGKTREVIGTELGVQIKRRSDGTVVWEGRAQTEARSDTPYAEPAAAIAKLAAALFQGFPGESGRTVTVK